MMAADCLRLAVADNCAVLDQGAALIETLPPGLYPKKHSFCYGSSIGGHFRHTLDHYASFIDGSRAGPIDYAARQRALDIESNPTRAAEAARALLARLGGLDPAELTGRIRLRSEFQAEDTSTGSALIESSPVRELEFLLSHTIHHFALIGTICGVVGVALPQDFGVAPSTLRHRRSLFRADLANQ